jgi:hypothetical protein
VTVAGIVPTVSVVNTVPPKKSIKTEKVKANQPAKKGK